MENINKIEIRGKIYKIELKMVNYKTVAQMVVVTDYVYNSNGEAKIESTYHRVEAWENTQVKDLTKLQVGSWVRVIGRYRTKNFKNEQGEDVYYMEIFADYVKKLADNTTECMNKVEIVGVVTKKDLKIINNSTVGNMTVVTSYVYNSKGDSTVESTYHRVEAWATPKIKDLVKIDVGATVKISGRYRKKSWEKDGKKNVCYEIYADNVKKMAES